MRISVDSRWVTPAVVAGLTIIADQISKVWVAQTLGPETMTQFIPIIGDSVQIVYSHNTGISFSMLQGMPEVLAVGALAIMAGAIYFYTTQLPNHRRIIQLIMGLILGGGLGNIIDRLRLGYVVDFISVGWFPIFNIADSAISVGATLLMAQFLLDELVQRRKREAMAPQ